MYPVIYCCCISVGLKDLKSLTDLLGSILSKLGSIKRTIIINIENKTGYRWLASNVHFDSGSSNAPMPYSINSGINPLTPNIKK